MIIQSGEYDRSLETLAGMIIPERWRGHTASVADINRSLERLAGT